MKKIFNSKLCSFIISGLVFSSITAYAINASEITYGNTTVDQVLNDLYNNITSDVIVDNLTEYTDGVKFEGESFYIYENRQIKWNSANYLGYKTIIFCHKIAGNNANFTATLPFSLNGKSYDVVLIKKIGNYGWNPDTRNSSGTHLEVDVNYGTPELSEYYFYVGIK